jgi:hypothetical protein
MKKILNSLAPVGALLLGIVSHHYGTQLLNSKQTKLQEQAQIIIKAQAARIENQVNKIQEKWENVENLAKKLEEKLNVSNANKTIVTNKINSIKENGEQLENLLNYSNSNSNNNSNLNESNKTKIIEDLVNMKNDIDQVKDVLDNIFKGGPNSTNLVSQLDKYYEYLDGLTLLQEGAFLHLLMFLLILVIIFNITGIFFGNELINYFKLEDRFPKLAIIFKLRAKYQRYYLIYNILILVTICFIAIFLNLLVLFTQ